MSNRSEEDAVADIVDSGMIAFAERFNRALGKLKTAAESDTNALLLNDEVDALLTYMKAVSEEVASRTR